MNNLRTISELIEIPSFSEIENKKIIEYLIKKFEPYSSEIARLKNISNNKENLLIGINTKLKNVSDAIVLSGHIDTVVADEKSYDTNPYQPTIKNGKLFGLGVIDMKCFFASIIDNLEQIKQIQKPVIVAITSDEETRFNGIKLVCEFLKNNNIKPKFTIIGEPTSLKLCTSSKSCFEYQINVRGKSCHSSNPNNGINANYIVAKLALFIEKMNKKFAYTTLNCGIIRGGEKSNIVPQSASITFDQRCKKMSYAKAIICLIKRKISQLKTQYQGCEIEIINNLSVLPLENNNMQLVENIAKNFDLQIGEFIGGCEAGYYSKLGSTTILFGAGDLSLAHKPNEFLDIEDYIRYNKIFIKILNFVENQI